MAVYTRQRGTRANGGHWDDATIQAVWNKGAEIAGYDRNVWRRDVCGAAMRRTDYGNVNSKYGWEIDHIKPVAKGGTDDSANLQPLQWENNRYKSDNYPGLYCARKG